MTNDPSGKSDARVLVVEDEVLVAMHIEDVLTELGCLVVKVATNLQQALSAARAEDIDFAVLDINLGGSDRSYPVADILRERQIPFLFVSGYTSGGLSEEYRAAVRLRKPFRTRELAQAIEQIQSA
jgi:CheY-like chemotaxis protein